MTGRGERGIWQRRYWEHTIRDERDFAAHMDYAHFNPAPTLPSPVIPGSSPGRGGLGRGAPGGLAALVVPPRVASGLYPAGWTGGNAEPQATGERR
jgi:putative transposase